MIYLLENVAGLVKHFLKISKQLIQLLAAARHKVTKPGKHFCLEHLKKGSPGHSAVLPAHPLHLQLALVDDLLQADRVSVPDLTTKRGVRTYKIVLQSVSAESRCTASESLISYSDYIDKARYK